MQFGVSAVLGQHHFRLPGRKHLIKVRTRVEGREQATMVIVDVAFEP